GRFAVLPGASPSSITDPRATSADLQDQVGKGSVSAGYLPDGFLTTLSQVIDLTKKSRES
ncbi:hypothetical protein, partial [Paractinoplanes deccanensis]|uniref:hypothetical protein n=1 Tax=Paractinoplanes deccanensis TaxID=113561 RepID=UPI0036218866